MWPHLIFFNSLFHSKKWIGTSLRPRKSLSPIPVHLTDHFFHCAESIFYSITSQRIVFFSLGWTPWVWANRIFTIRLLYTINVTNARVQQHSLYNNMNLITRHTCSFTRQWHIPNLLMNLRNKSSIDGGPPHFQNYKPENPRSLAARLSKGRCSLLWIRSAGLIFWSCFFSHWIIFCQFPSISSHLI